MNIFVNTYNVVEGFHRWDGAKGAMSYLASRHRHLFVIRGSFKVSHGDREIEINEMQNKIENYLHLKYGKPCEFKGMSCEHIATELIEKFSMESCQVLEDGYGGATLTR